MGQNSRQPVLHVYPYRESATLWDGKFKEISLAHEILSDNATRRQYDRDRCDGQKTRVPWGGEKAKDETTTQSGVRETTK